MSTDSEVTTTPTSDGCGCGGCGCGGAATATATATVSIGTAPRPADADAQDLDLRPLPHAERHDRVFAAVAALVPGEAFVLAVDHNPLRLRAQLDAEQPGELAWQLLDAGPDIWRVQISRVSCC